MKKVVSIVLGIFIITVWGVSISDAAKFDIALGMGYHSGDTTYRIGGRVDSSSGSETVHFPISELEFPLDVYMVSAKASMEFAGKWKLSLGAKKNISSDAGKMKDSDWLIPNSLDIYSESDADLDALILDVNLRYKFYESFHGDISVNERDTINRNIKWSFFSGLGYIHQNFDYEIKNLDQWYPSSPETPHDYVSGLVLTYEVTYDIPYIEIGTQFKYKESFSIEISLGGSPFVHVEDEDHHILRSKVNKTNYKWNRQAILFSLEGRYNFSNNWFMTLGFDYTKISAEGRSEAYFEGVYDHSIDDEIESEQAFTSLMVGYSF